MKPFLNNVLAYKQAEVKALKQQMADNLFAELFAVDQKQPILIAEIKPKSPSKGKLYKGDLIRLAKIYQDAGAQAISVLTDGPSFGGNLDLLQQVKQVVKVPVLRKDFIIHPSQLVESVRYGADAVLLITAIVTPQELKQLIVSANRLGLAAVVEVFDEGEVEKALKAGATIIGVNSRNLRTLEVNVESALKTLSSVPVGISTLLFSGIETRANVVSALSHGAKGVLVGTVLMQASDVFTKIKELLYD